jgi:hypothetical protein
MVAYSFAARFAEAVEAGTKRQTIRAIRARHARPGEPVQLYVAQRSKLCRKLVDPDPVCTLVSKIEIDITRDPKTGAHSIEGIRMNGHPVDESDVAWADGFDTVEDMADWFGNTHGAGTFTGVLIQWSPTP